MFIKIIMGIILLGLIAGTGYIVLTDVNIPQEEVVIEIDAKPSE